MLVADTNVWARALLNDDPFQARLAQETLAGGRAKDGIFVPMIVLAELTWVLRKRWERDRVLDTLEKLLQTRGVRVEAPTLVRDALTATRTATGGGFADHLVAQVGFAHGAREVVTFDEKFARTAQVRLLKGPIRPKP